MDFTTAAKTAMNRQKINMSELAKRTGYSIQYISDLLSGQRRWNETTMNKVCEALGITVEFKFDAA